MSSEPEWGGKMMSLRRIGIVIMVFAVLLAGCKSTKSDVVVGEVNGDKITQAELDQEYRLLKMTYEQNYMYKLDANGQAQKEKGSLDPVKDKQIIDELKKQAFEAMVMQKLLLQQGEKEGIEISDKDLDAELNKYQQSLKENKMDTGLYRNELKSQMIQTALYQKVTRGIEPTEAELKKYYQDHLGDFTTGGGIQISHILVKTEKEAQDILAQLNNGADFAALAKKYSTCPSKDKGGDLGIVNEETNFVKEFKDAALQLKPGEMTKAPVKTQFGYHIIKAGQRQASQARTYEQARNEIIIKQQKLKQNQVFQDYLNQLKKKAQIKNYNQSAAKNAGKKADSSGK